ncbi:DUF262 domain-containing protein [Sporosarcina sp. ANT_H38]|uniref:GmrSD restriction endonuclease domain-containing protein n=1 Tax=Sporosarcina sp. ANT_H38 TaxID=2597358 RepID=UPI0011F22058|nr:DUF262 domain-containing protein [Sporosarcina sp. ANT_H38]KAA0941648.1 DUF262 domain-containing protein [Sporosarcina sp. ANT_H38]
MAIKIKQSLLVNAFNDPTKETVNKSVSQICNEVGMGQIIMPIFQRDLAWTTSKKVDLYNFQLNGSAPVAPISMNKIGAKSVDMPHVTLLNRLEVDNKNNIQGNLSVVDGQQRISTNYQAFINDESIRSIVLDISRGVFLDIKDKDIKKNQIPVGVLYNQDPIVYTEYIRTHPLLMEFDVSSLLGQIRTKFNNYFYTVNFAHDLPGEEQIKWFDVLNLAGSRVPDIQMKLTRLQINGLDFYKDYSKVFREKLEINGLDLFVQKNTEVSIPLATLNPAFEITLGKSHTSNYSPMASDKKESIIIEMTSDKLSDCFEMTLAGLDRALEFINENSLLDPERIDYITYLTGYFVYKNGEPLANSSNQNLIDWYTSADFGSKTNSERREMFNEILSL